MSWAFLGLLTVLSGITVILCFAALIYSIIDLKSSKVLDGKDDNHLDRVNKLKGNVMDNKLAKQYLKPGRIYGLVFSGGEELAVISEVVECDGTGVLLTKTKFLKNSVGAKNRIAAMNLYLETQENSMRERQVIAGKASDGKTASWHSTATIVAAYDITDYL